MNKNTQIALTLLALAVIGLLFHDAVQKNRKIQELEDALASNNVFSETIKKQLLKLLEDHPHVDEDVKGELHQIALLAGIQQETKAILSLAKIIENLLKKLYKDDIDFKEFYKTRNKANDIKSRSASFADYLDYANKMKLIPDDDYLLIKVLKMIRNQEAHELNVVKSRDKLIGCFISGISVVIGLYNEVKGAIHLKEQKSIGLNS